MPLGSAMMLVMFSYVFSPDTLCVICKRPGVPKSFSRSSFFSSSGKKDGVFRLVCSDVTLKASGPVASFQYVVLVNKTKGLPVAFCDRGRPVLMEKFDKCVIGFNGEAGVFTDK